MPNTVAKNKKTDTSLSINYTEYTQSYNFESVAKSSESLQAWLRCVGARNTEGSNIDLYAQTLLGDSDKVIPTVYFRGNEKLHALLATPIIESIKKSARIDAIRTAENEVFTVLPANKLSDWLELQGWTATNNPDQALQDESSSRLQKHVFVGQFSDYKELSYNRTKLKYNHTQFAILKENHGPIDILICLRITYNRPYFTKFFIKYSQEDLNLSFAARQAVGIVPSRLDYALCNQSSTISRITEKRLYVTAPRKKSCKYKQTIIVVKKSNKKVKSEQSEHEELMHEAWISLKSWLLKNIKEDKKKWLEENIHIIKRMTVRLLHKLSKKADEESGTITQLDYYNLLYERGLEMLLFLLMNSLIKENTYEQTFLSSWIESTGISSSLFSHRFHNYGMQTLFDLLPKLKHKDTKCVFISPQHYHQYKYQYEQLTQRYQFLITSDRNQIINDTLPDVLFSELNPSNAGDKQQLSISIEETLSIWAKTPLKPLHVVIDVTIGSHKNEKLYMLLKKYSRFITEGLLTIDVIISLSKDFPQCGSANLPGGLTIRIGRSKLLNRKKTSASQKLLEKYFSVLWVLNEHFAEKYNKLREQNVTYLASEIEYQINSQCLSVVQSTAPVSFLLLSISRDALISLWPESYVSKLVSIMSGIKYRQSLGFNKTCISPISKQGLVRLSVGLESAEALKAYSKSIIKLSYILTRLNQVLTSHFQLICPPDGMSFLSFLSAKADQIYSTLLNAIYHTSNEANDFYQQVYWNKDTFRSSFRLSAASKRYYADDDEISDVEWIVYRTLIHSRSPLVSFRLPYFQQINEKPAARPDSPTFATCTKQDGVILTGAFFQSLVVPFAFDEKKIYTPNDIKVQSPTNPSEWVLVQQLGSVGISLWSTLCQQGFALKKSNELLKITKNPSTHRCIKIDKNCLYNLLKETLPKDISSKAMSKCALTSGELK